MIRQEGGTQASADAVVWPAYQPQVFEPVLQREWETLALYAADSRALDGSGTRLKFYCLDFFPYPSGDGLHVGHCRNYVPTDVTSRFYRMRGYNVLHPMGWDAFGEPAEQTALAHGVHPRVTTDRNSARFRNQLQLLGTSYDWSREIDSSNPRFYRWTQYFFIKMYKRGLAYRDTNWQWWCPVCLTTLSSHEIKDGVCWRGHTGVSKREIPAWYFRITSYADELLLGLEQIDWPEPVKAMQRNWIGRSEGTELRFTVETGEPLVVFTTRPDTLYGVTFLVLAPEHPRVDQLTASEKRAEVAVYRDRTAQKSEIERQIENREKTGVFTGRYAVHPLSGERIPVWIADYVLPHYGTGAVMGVPAHDARDLAFARRYALEIKTREAPPGWEGENGSVEPYTGLEDPQDYAAYVADLEVRGIGKRAVSYRMRDWLISRQRYWGTPIPIVYCPGCGEVPVPEEDLPVELPWLENFQPDGSGRSPLAQLDEFVNTTCPHCKGPAKRETDTMGGFACSSWYFLRFTSPHDDTGPFDHREMQYWMPVDLYVGGVEHAVLHLLYARFWTMVLADIGLLPFREPFTRLRNQGQLQGPDGQRMSKSRGNVITPDEMVAQYGADALRLYEMFMAPFDQDVAWSEAGINGLARFLNRVWNLYAETYIQSRAAQDTDETLERLRHRTIRQVSERIIEFRFNTMVSALMEYVNALAERQRRGKWRTATFHQALETLLYLLAPGAPHIADELWRRTGHLGSVHSQAWPDYNPDLARDEANEIPVQIDGRLRSVLAVTAEMEAEAVLALAEADPRVAPHLVGRTLVRRIYVPGRVVNFVTRSV